MSLNINIYCVDHRVYRTWNVQQIDIVEAGEKLFCQSLVGIKFREHNIPIPQYKLQLHCMPSKYIGITCVTLFQTFDEGLVIYLYDSVPGYTLIGVRILSWIWFLYAIFFTLKHFPEKSVFYVIFGLTFTAWWVGLPTCISYPGTRPKYSTELIVHVYRSTHRFL